MNFIKEGQNEFGELTYDNYKVDEIKDINSVVYIINQFEKNGLSIERIGISFDTIYDCTVSKTCNDVKDMTSKIDNDQFNELDSVSVYGIQNDQKISVHICPHSNRFSVFYKKNQK